MLYTQNTQITSFMYFTVQYIKKETWWEMQNQILIFWIFFFRLVNKCCPNVDQMELLTNGMDWIRFTTDFVTLSRIFTENVFPRVLAQCTHAFKAKIAHVLT